MGKNQKLGVFDRKDRKLPGPPPCNSQFSVLEAPLENANWLRVVRTLEPEDQPAFGFLSAREGGTSPDGDSRVMLMDVKRIPRATEPDAGNVDAACIRGEEEHSIRKPQARRPTVAMLRSQVFYV